MAVNAEIFQGIQLGLESSYGVAVPADKHLLAMGVMLDIDAESNDYRNRGDKYMSRRIPNKEWSTGELDGTPNYNEIIYPLSGLLASGVVTGSGVSTWTFTSSNTGPDTVKSFTAEQGSSVFAVRSAGLMMQDFTMNWDRNGGLEMSGAMFGKALESGITMTATPDEITPADIVSGHVELYMDETFGAIGTTRLEKAFKAEFSLTGKVGPVYYFSRSAGLGHSAFVELPPDLMLNLEMEMDAQAMELLTQFRAGQVAYFRMEAISDVTIPGSSPAVDYSMVIDFMGVPKPGKQGDVDGVHSLSWEVLGLHDATAGKAFSIIVKNELAAL